MIREYDFTIKGIAQQNGSIANVGGVGVITGLSGLTPVTSSPAGTWIAFGLGVPNNAIITASTSSTVTINQPPTATGSGTFTLGQNNYPLPTDYERPVDNTFWDRSRFWSMRGPQSPQQWQLYKSSVIGRASIQRRFRFLSVRNNSDDFPTTYLSIDPDPTDNGSQSLVGPIIYSGANNAGMEVRLKNDIVTDLNLEVGFIDAVPGSNASGVTDDDTPTAVFSDGAVIQIDTDQTLATLALVTKGAAVTIRATTLTSPITVPTAATYWTFRCQLVGQKAYFWVNGVLVPHAVTVNHITAATLLAPWIYVRTRDTTTKLTDVDYVDLWADRA